MHRVGHVIRVALRGAGLVCKLPGLWLHTQAAYRKFRQEFVHSAAQEGMPEELAQHIAHGLRPAEYLSALRKEKDKAGSPTG